MFQNIKESPLKLPSHLSGEVKDLVAKLMNRASQMRLGMGREGAEEVKNHPWFKSIDWSIVESRKLPVPKPEMKPVEDKEISAERLGKDEAEKEYIEGWDFQVNGLCVEVIMELILRHSVHH
eukprot:TRINITY_DN5944_c0_g1_i4.p2 TRINITY_DN5944_c0_g1~~TRINITY_DN5944_c0_g1_i4.p2  ORF type:complete len:122 (-),score=20.85 TRINITY_DN5944_c0_g1_i4:127-492(-)